MTFLATETRAFTMQNQFLPPQTTEATTPYVTPSGTVQTAENAETIPATQTITELLAQIQHKTLRRKKRVRQSLLLIFAHAMAVIPYVFIPALRHWLNGLGMIGYVIDVPFMYAFLYIISLSRLSADSNIDLLAQSAGKQAIPALLDALSLNASPAYNKPYIQALMTLLPQLQATDVTLLTPTHRRYLNALLRSVFLPIWMGGSKPEFAVAILKAYEQAGDKTAIPVVERIARTGSYTQNQLQIIRAARECLPLLRVNAGGVETTQTLLRASMPHTAAPDTLLRAATTNVTTPDNELLRATTPYDIPPSS